MEKLPTPISSEHLEKIKKWLGSGAINIFGPPFAGKDTHGHELSQLFDAPLLSSGQIFRENRGVLSPEELEMLDTGDLPPSDTFFKLVKPSFSKPEFDGHPLILSSVGRKLGEHTGVLEAAEQSGHPIKAVFYLHLKDSTVFERRDRSQEKGDRPNRPEDATDVLKTRLQKFESDTLEVIEEYRKLGLVIEVDSDANKQEVLVSMLARLYLLASQESA